jgi:hypothetical protein
LLLAVCVASGCGHGRKATDTSVREHDNEFAKFLCRRRNGPLGRLDILRQNQEL